MMLAFVIEHPEHSRIAAIMMERVFIRTKTAFGTEF
jgi:hypothetical protein